VNTRVKTAYVSPQLVTLDATRLRDQLLADVRRLLHQALDNLLNGDWRSTRDTLERAIDLIERT